LHNREEVVNKAELIEALTVRLGDRKTATAALDAVLAEIQGAVTKGERVAITGFGAFEKRARAARTARNPRTGEAVKVKKTSVPTFRPGSVFKEMVASGKAPKAAAPAKKAATAKATTARKTAPATKSTAKSAPAKKATTKSTTAKAAAKKTTATSAATKSTAKSTAAKKAPAKKTTAAKSTAAKKAPAKKTARR